VTFYLDFLVFKNPKFILFQRTFLENENVTSRGRGKGDRSNGIKCQIGEGVGLEFAKKGHMSTLAVPGIMFFFWQCLPLELNKSYLTLHDSS